MTTTRIAKHLGKVKDLAAFLGAIHGALGGEMSALFRGHRDVQWSLVPAIARQNLVITPPEEAAMLDEFKRRAIPYLDSNHDLNAIDWLAIAQHHGMPTRLLDWSGSALTALWFAINEAANGKAHAAVWILAYDEGDLTRDDERDTPLRVQRTSLVRPRHVSRRITAQDGWFTLHRSHYGDDESPTFVSLETNRDYKKRLFYLTIPPDAFGAMRMQLAQAGVTGAVLYPDLTGVASYVTWRHVCREDEFSPRLIGY
ncbi:FRG domain-containing protein [Burkholderia ambifaria]|uniref:FRG domain-containing protein n=1 Tax=Burkholderia ambifaria TaxID=152480 RepID=UPI00201354D1|nr:FRG domain-containing protein [Burkholderia ambifaria]